MHLVKNWEPAPARSVLAVRDAVEHRKSGSWPFPTSQWGITSVRIQTTEHIHNVISNWKGFSEGNGVLTKLLGGLTRKSRNHHWTIYLNGIVLTLILKTGRCCYYWHGCPLTTNSKLETRLVCHVYPPQPTLTSLWPCSPAREICMYFLNFGKEGRRGWVWPKTSVFYTA